MLGTKIFLLLSLSVLGNSIPQPEFRIHIHLHQDNFQPGPARGPTSNILPAGRPAEGGNDYGDSGDYGEYSIGRFG